MALSGSFTTSAYNNRSLTFSWSATQSVSGNYSTITWSLKGSGSQTQYFKSAPFKVVIAGEQVYYSETRIQLRNGTTVASGTKTIYHRADGTMGMTASVSAAIYSYSENVSGSGEWILDTIARGATLSAAPNFDDEGNPQITYSNPAGNSVTELKACIANTTGSIVYVPYRDITKTGTSYTFNLTEAERNTLRAACNTANSMSVKFYVYTKIGTTEFYSTLTKTLSIVNATPTLTANVIDRGSVSTVLTGNNQTMIKGYNGMYATASGTAKKGATISSYKITNGGTVVNGAAAAFDYTESNVFNFEVTDSRGNKATSSITVPMINYIPLTCTVDGKILLNSADSTKADLTFTVSGNYYNGSFGAANNSLTVNYYITDNSNNSIMSGYLSDIAFDNGTYTASLAIADLDYQKSYTVLAEAVDAITRPPVQSQSKTLKTTPAFDWGESDFNFNVPVSFNNTPMVDFIEEQGEQDGWFYRKWNSGVAECWKIYYEGRVNAAATNYNGFYYSPTISVPFPFTFVNLPTVTVDGGSTANMNFVRAFGSYSDAATFVVVGLANVTSTDITVHIKAIGRWK